MNAINQTGAQTFSFARYAALLKTYLVENGKTLALYTAVLVGISILVGGFCGYNFSTPNRLSGDPYASTLMMYTYISIAYSFCFSISASFMFTTLQTRATRISTFMLPASLLEKYLVRYTVYFVLFLICFIIAMLCGEGVRMLASSPETTSIFENTKLMYQVFSAKYSGPYLIIYLVGSALSTHATYTLGSALWPKYSFFKTFILSMIIGILVVCITPTHFMIDYTEGIFNNTWYIIAGVYVWAILLYGLSWWRFRTTQIVQRFMMD
jgi:hypothetical protein